MVYRIFTEKKKELAAEANALLEDIRSLLQITSVTALRIINRYDAENITEELFDYAIHTVFSEPQLDLTYRDLPNDGAVVFAVEYLPGQFDQRADSAAQCIQLISRGDRPLVRTAKVYRLYGDITDAQLSAIKKYVINPVESREASLEKPETLVVKYELPSSVAAGRVHRARRPRAFRFHPSVRACHGHRRPSLLSGLLPIGTPRPHRDRDSNDRHLLVGSLPSHHFSHSHRPCDF